MRSLVVLHVERLRTALAQRDAEIARDAEAAMEERGRSKGRLSACCNAFLSYTAKAASALSMGIQLMLD